MNRIALIIAFAVCVQLGPTPSAFALDRFKMLDLKVGDHQLTGRILTHKDDWCWFLQRDGRLEKIAMEQVTQFVERSDRFKVCTHLELKKQLQAEFGSDFDVSITTHYVVAAPRGRGDSYAAIFEQIYCEFVRFFRGRGLRVVDSEFPLIATVYPNQYSFMKYCADQKTPVRPGLVGFYMATSNRVAMYERPNVFDLDNTAIHEATHQVAFNTGVHSRLAQHPRWIVEGLATVFEADGIRSRQGTTSPAERINRERFLWFREYAASRRPTHALENFIRSETMFETSVLDGYSEAWALSFFLIEVHPTAYSKYLRRVVERDPLITYDSDTRYKDFVEFFGSDVERFETSFLRFIRQIQKH